MAQSHNQNPAEQQAPGSNTQTQQETSIRAIGGQLEVDVGDGQYVPVPNTSGREPTYEEMHQALVAAGHQARADELASIAYGNVMGTE